MYSDKCLLYNLFPKEAGKVVNEFTASKIDGWRPSIPEEWLRI